MDGNDGFIATYQKVLAARKQAEYCELRGQPLHKRVCRWGALSASLMNTLLDMCPLGDGSLYESMVLDALARTLHGVVDSELARRQVPVQGGFCDIELPVCTEVSHGHRLWYEWSQYYGIKSLLVEVKNMRGKASYEDVNQLRSYLEGAKRGECGMLVSRSGFTASAMSRMSSLLRDDRVLILPLDHTDIKRLLEFSTVDSQKTMTYLRRKENLLFRFNDRPFRG